ncbi:MAG: hypothetical protein ACI9T7_003044 [Oleiphilaceae bacterium]|jgi:hypothetical protein
MIIIRIKFEQRLLSRLFAGLSGLSSTVLLIIQSNSWFNQALYIGNVLSESDFRQQELTI